jgi:hypothetical protein
MTVLSRTRGLIMAALVLVAGAALLGSSAARSSTSPSAKAVRLADATMIVEVNATDGDAGLQVFLDGDPWRSMRISGPGGWTFLDIEARGRLKGYGLTELFSESSEPAFKTFPLRKFKKLWPAGRYTFRGRTIAGKEATGRATLSHDIPTGPEISAPADESTVARDGVVARWDRGNQPRGVEIVGYRAIVTREDPLRVFSADLSASVRQVTVPADFLERGTEYKLEVQAIEASGNQTLTEITFRVR